MKILLLSRVPPDPTHSGCGFYLSDLLTYLTNHGATVRALWGTYPYELHAKGYLSAPGLKDLPYEVRVENCFLWNKTLIRPKSYLDSLWAQFLHGVKSIAPFLTRFRKRKECEPQKGSESPSNPNKRGTWDEPLRADEAAWFKTEILAFKPDVLLVNYPWLLHGLKDILPRPIPICTLVHDFRPRLCQIIDGVFQAHVVSDELAAEEKGWLKNSHLLVAVQDGEASLFREFAPDQPVIIARQALELKLRAAHRNSAHVCGMVGSLNQANTEALHWFASEVWPIVRRRAPKAQLLVAGAVCKSLDKPDPTSGIQLLGYVPSLQAFYESIDIAVVPLLRGSGIKIKLLEATSYQVPVVSTMVGLDGLEFFGDSVLIANTASEFAERIIQLFQDTDRRNKMIKTANEVIRQTLSPRECYGPLNTELQKLADPAQFK